MANAVFTIGHSVRPLGVFIELLKSADVRLVVDVRAFPRSRTNPHYNEETLASSLSSFQIGYRHIPELGGRRARQPNVSRATNAFWQNESFHNYADYAMGDDFRTALERLRQLGHSERYAIMCAEALWWQCHRRIISDYLIAAGEDVFHILGADHVARASMTPAARLGVDGVLTYPVDGMKTCDPSDARS
jgi:uncharacterized protein (DUF488 family)